MNFDEPTVLGNSIFRNGQLVRRNKLLIGCFRSLGVCPLVRQSCIKSASICLQISLSLSPHDRLLFYYPSNTIWICKCAVTAILMKRGTDTAKQIEFMMQWLNFLKVSNYCAHLNATQTSIIFYALHKEIHPLKALKAHSERLRFSCYRRLKLSPITNMKMSSGITDRLTDPRFCLLLLFTVLPGWRSLIILQRGENRP